jgi:fumarate reductase flavoprotein subunit
MSCDVLILGAGLAGLAAAIAAAQSGARVRMLEKCTAIGGSTALSSGLHAYAGTDEQASAGIRDTPEQLREDVLATGRRLSDPALVDTYCHHQLSTYRWLKQLGVEFGSVHAASGQSVPRSHATNPPRVLETLLERATAVGVEVHCEVRASRLLVADDKVVGARVAGVASGTPTDYRAGAVVLATGGFSRSPRLLARFAPRLAHAIPGGSPGSEGDGLLMAWNIGADFRDTPFIKGTFGIYPQVDPRECGTGILAVYKGAIAVNARGERFVDESQPYKVIGDACLEQPGGTAYQIFDATTMAHDDPSVDIYSFGERLKNGLLASASTLEELAHLIQVPADSLNRTVADYNAAVRGQRTDAFGRRSLSSGVGTPTAVEAPPFYAHLSGSCVLATYCGLTVDVGTRVLNVFGEPIPGLYAAGEITGGFHGDGYVTGTSLGKASVFGRLAGEAARNHALGKAARSFNT